MLQMLRASIPLCLSTATQSPQSPARAACMQSAACMRARPIAGRTSVDTSPLSLNQNVVPGSSPGRIFSVNTAGACACGRQRK
eukprot:4763910-Pleurochrysis_carterae.AAC.4